MQTERIAVVSTDGLNVDDHFGKARRFLIYDLNFCIEPVVYHGAITDITAL